MEGKKYREPVEFDVIRAAIQGDADSINQIISYFQPYINARCRRKFKDEFGHEHYMTDEYMKRRLETKLITKILDFKIQVCSSRIGYPFLFIGNEIDKRTLTISYRKSCRMYEAAELFNEYARTICIRHFATRCRKVVGIRNEGMLMRTLK